MPVIYSYTRAQAIEDGVLVDLTEWARETGFKYPVACTSEVWHRYISPPAETRELRQSERGRTHDLLRTLFLCIQGSRTTADKDLLLFEVLFLQAPSRTEIVSLKSLCGPGDDGEPVITILLPHED
ncbi:MAG: hypothetical protein IPK83_18980 [Planctomycetes bacterium]|nr:hypothetical protein [Planctomycetota bacterium]